MATISSPYTPPHNPQPAAFWVWLIRLPILLITGGLMLTIILSLLVGAFRYRYMERITPGVTVFGVALDGLDRDEAIGLLSGRFTYDAATVFTFRDGERAWQLSAGTLGLSFDVAATVDQALAVSQPDNVLQGLLQQAQTWMNGHAIAPIIRYDQNLAIAQLNRIAAEVNQAPQDASLRIGEDLSISTTPAQPGRTLDVDATLVQLNNAMLALNGGAEVPLIINEALPAIWNADLAINRIEAALSAPLTLTAVAEDGAILGPWTIEPQQIAALLQVDLAEQMDGTWAYTVNADLSGFSTALESLADGLRSLPSDGRFSFDPITRQLIPIQPPQLGRALNVTATLARLQAAVFRYDDRNVMMAFDYVQPRYHAGVTAAELGISELIGEATTFYNGSGPNRRHNIAEGTARLNGIIIGPGEEFSFNDFVGEISLESGFKEGAVIVGNSTVAGVGGGICQVSTTIFRAALNGGYWITERNTHAYRVHYYELNGQPTGLDAAIWSPDRDLKFLNDTPYHILIEAIISPGDSTLTFRIYSTPTGRQVEILAPEIRDVVPAPATRFRLNSDLQTGDVVQTEIAADGMDVVVIRRVTEPDGRTRTDRVFTHYLPWGAVYEVAPGDPRLSQSTGG